MQRRHRKAHAVIWTSIAICLPLLLVVVFASVPKLPADAPAIRLDNPASGDAR